MTMFRMDPFVEFDRLNRMFSEVNAGMRTPVDAYRSGDAYVVEFDLPGIDAASIDVSVEGNVLTVKGTRSVKRAESREVVLAERYHGSFTRTLYLGSELDATGVAARYSDGVLEVTIPISERARPRKVEVEMTSGARTLEGTASN